VAASDYSCTVAGGPDRKGPHRIVEALDAELLDGAVLIYIDD
jgi:hypothetical protein